MSASDKTRFNVIDYTELHLLRLVAFIWQIRTPLELVQVTSAIAESVGSQEMNSLFQALFNGPVMIRRQEGKTSEVKLSQQIPQRHPTPFAALAAAERRHAFSCQHPQREIRAPVFKARCSASFPACTHANLLGWPPACSQVVCQDQQAPDTKERDVARESLSNPSCWHTLWKRILAVTTRSKWLPCASR